MKYFTFLAGTHDIKLLHGVINSLEQAADDQVTLVPRYDKSQRGGRGDRMSRELWTQVTGRPDIILLEGGFLS